MLTLESLAFPLQGEPPLLGTGAPLPSASGDCGTLPEPYRALRVELVTHLPGLGIPEAPGS